MPTEYEYQARRELWRSGQLVVVTFLPLQLCYVHDVVGRSLMRLV